MVTLDIRDKVLIVTIQRLGNKILAMKNEMIIPLAHIRGVVADPGVFGISKGWHGPGAAIPDVIYAGTFHVDGGKAFWDVHNPANAIVVELENEEFNQLVIEVESPKKAVALIEKHIA